MTYEGYGVSGVAVYIKCLSDNKNRTVAEVRHAFVKTGGNLLLLDEPTNDLDVETLRALEEALLEFPGCAMVISHDRWFLDRIATHILDYRDEGQVNFFEGNFTDYNEWLKKTLGPAALEPHRIKYKKIN